MQKWEILQFEPSGLSVEKRCLSIGSVCAENKEEAQKLAVERYPQLREFQHTEYDPFRGVWVNAPKNLEPCEPAPIYSVHEYIVNRKAALREKIQKEIDKYEKPGALITFEELPASIQSNIIINKKGCWIWMGDAVREGYGAANFNGKRKAAHRLVYELYYGEIPEHGFLLHECDNRLCVSPHHLSVGSVYDNNDDTAGKGKMRIGKKRRNNWFVIDAGIKPIAGLSNDEQVALRQQYYDLGWSVKKLAGIYGIPKAEAKRIADGYLTYNDIREIRQKYHSDASTIPSLEEEFGIHRSIVRKLIRYEKFTTQDEENKRWARFAQRR